MRDADRIVRVHRLRMVLMAAMAFVWAWLPHSPAQAGPEDGRRTMFLVARPGLPDPNFRESVVLVMHHENGETAGVIINRPTDRSLASILPGDKFRRFTEPVFFGGPVMSQGLFAVYRAEKRIGDSLTLLPGVYLATETSALDELMHDPPQRVRFYSGLSGWSPGQLQAEIERGDWLVLKADADTVFLSESDIRQLWGRLVRTARTITAGIIAPSAAHLAR
jgi:putative transcriptional regulator